MTLYTKNALAASLKKLLSKKRLNKITVADIAEDCAVNRQTFYYHFRDVYALVEWIYTNEAEGILDGKKSYTNWRQGFSRVLRYILDNKAFVLNTYNSLSREHLERYLYHAVYRLLYDAVKEMAASGVVVLREDDARFIANFYKYGFVGLGLDWIGAGMEEPPEIIVTKLSTLMHGVFAQAIKNFTNEAKCPDF
jgi:probable dihydroxyacetone kinase regulator